MSDGLTPSARVLRGFATDFLTSHDVSAVQWVMDPDYRLSIGGHLFEGRDDSYLPATAAQLDMFPGLVVTAHDVILGTDAVALRFTEHGVSVKNPGKAAAWRGITLFRLKNGRLEHGWAEEDYYARKRQLKSGECDAVAPPHPAPWDVPTLAPDAATEAMVRAWLSDPTSVLSGDVEQVMVEGPSFGALIMPTGITVSQMFSAGDRAAFHAVVEGSYARGFPDIAAAHAGAPIVLRMAGMLSVHDGGVRDVQISADRLGLHRHMLSLGAAA